MSILSYAVAKLYSFGENKSKYSFEDEWKALNNSEIFNNLCSSSACCLNLFYYLKNNIGLANKIFSELMGKEINIKSDIIFEYKILDQLPINFQDFTFRARQDVMFSYFYKENYRVRTRNKFMVYYCNNCKKYSK